MLYHGVRHEEYVEGHTKDQAADYGRTYFDSLQFNFPLKGFELEETDENIFQRHELTLSQFKLKTELERQIEIKHEREIHTQQNLKTYAHLDSTFIQSPSLFSQISGSWPLLKIDTLTSIQQALSQARSIKNAIRASIERDERTQKKLNRYLYEFHILISEPLNVLFCMLIGIALGAIIRKGGLGIPALISTLLLVFAYVLNTQGKKLAKESLIDPTLAAWLPCIIFGSLALFLIYQATRERRLLID